MGDWGLYREGGWETGGFTEEDGKLGALQRRMMGDWGLIEKEDGRLGLDRGGWETGG